MGTDGIIYMRTDANSNIATGHLVRCLSIAAACLSLGRKVCFLVSDEESHGLLKEFISHSPSVSQKLSVRVLKTASYYDLEQELPEVLDLLSHDASVINQSVIYFLDSYYVTEKYLASIKEAVPIAYLDDLQLFDYPVDLVVNYDVIPESLMPAYLAAYQNSRHRLLGPSYAPLRPAFNDTVYEIRSQVSHILVTTGGSDPYHFCLQLIQTYSQKMHLTLKGEAAAPYHLHIVVGSLNKDKKALCLSAGPLPFITLHENVSDMAALMESCDLAVSAAGTTLYELCAVGVPAVSFTMADNQLAAAKAFADMGVIPCAGDIRNSLDGVLDQILDFMTYMSQNFEKRKTAHKIMRSLIDGQGSMRIAEELDKL